MITSHSRLQDRNVTKITLTMELGSGWFTQWDHKTVNPSFQTGAHKHTSEQPGRCQSSLIHMHSHTVQRRSLISQETDNTCVGATRLCRGSWKIGAVSVTEPKWNDPNWIRIILKIRRSKQTLGYFFPQPVWRYWPFVGLGLATISRSIEKSNDFLITIADKQNNKVVRLA